MGALGVRRGRRRATRPPAGGAAAVRHAGDQPLRARPAGAQERRRRLGPRAHLRRAGGDRLRGGGGAAADRQDGRHLSRPPPVPGQGAAGTGAGRLGPRGGRAPGRGAGGLLPHHGGDHGAGARLLRRARRLHAPAPQRVRLPGVERDRRRRRAAGGGRRLCREVRRIGQRDRLLHRRRRREPGRLPRGMQPGRPVVAAADRVRGEQPLRGGHPRAGRLRGRAPVAARLRLRHGRVRRRRRRRDRHPRAGARGGGQAARRRHAGDHRVRVLPPLPPRRRRAGQRLPLPQQGRGGPLRRHRGDARAAAHPGGGRPARPGGGPGHRRAGRAGRAGGAGGVHGGGRSAARARELVAGPGHGRRRHAQLRRRAGGPALRRPYAGGRERRGRWSRCATRTRSRR